MKPLGVRKERWTCECWRLGPWCNTSRDSISYVHDSTLFFFPFVTSWLFGKVYYRLYADDYEVPSKVALDPKKPSLGLMLLRRPIVSLPLKDAFRESREPQHLHMQIFLQTYLAILHWKHLNPSHWWLRLESEWAYGKCSNAHGHRSNEKPTNPRWEVCHKKSSSGGDLLDGV